MQALRVRSMTNGETIMASAEIGAPPERVSGRWSARKSSNGGGQPIPTGWSLLADHRVGGRWTVVVRTAGGRDLPASGEFLEIETPRRIVQTWAYGRDHPTLGRRQTRVAWLLEPIADGTRVTICHAGFGGLREAAAEHAKG
ncbi:MULTISPECIES: SRPBCC family protein [Mesorhizobium]|uniref:SRPBCC family protein n=1 Tax=Mesorhizobium australicum TaxID=536018 RepID=UPI003337FFBC